MHLLVRSFVRRGPNAAGRDFLNTKRELENAYSTSSFLEKERNQRVSNFEEVLLER